MIEGFFLEDNVSIKKKHEAKKRYTQYCSAQEEKGSNQLDKNYKFVQNRACEYFPCHKTENQDTFNCLFCFCPLYVLKDECGGNFTYTKGVKNCSHCAVPHSPGGHEFVMEKIKKIIDLARKED